MALSAPAAARSARRAGVPIASGARALHQGAPFAVARSEPAAGAPASPPSGAHRL